MNSPFFHALIGGTQSGCGKTTFTLALLQWLQAQNKMVQAFKAGPDYLDPLWHEAITGQVSYNLDSQMMGEADCLDILSTKCQSEIALVEGVMGLFDGRSGVGTAGSSLDLARVTGSNVLLCINVKGMAGSIVPLVRGFTEEAAKSAVTISGVLANQVGSDHHLHLLIELLKENSLPPIVASMKKDAPILPERHLGLVEPTLKLPDFFPFLEVDEEALFAAFATCEHKINIKNPPEIKALEKKLFAGFELAILKDQALSFIYQSNLDWLVGQGAQISYFSILKGEDIPKNTQGLWLPGGYPELWAEEISKSKSLLAIKNYIEGGGATLAECGGMMILGESLTDLEGTTYPMARVLALKVTMQKKLASLGYRTDESGLAGESPLKGHEFHHSTKNLQESATQPFKLSRGDQGESYKNLTASYVHWYFPSNPQKIARIFHV
ncbi:MAG: cobyrinate a,c-diamide synthase [SAR324 cluster bacterium]|nr:cobyrinate a,c-diamide synthase [SAR324 cluster bacterium]